MQLRSIIQISSLLVVQCRVDVCVSIL
jgi:hypothetical protein